MKLTAQTEGFPEMKRELQGMLARAGSAGRPVMLNDAGRQTVKVVEKRFAVGGPGWPKPIRGGKPLWNTGLMAASNDFRVSAGDLAAGNTRPFAGVHNDGKVIRAKKAKFLRFPILSGRTIVGWAMKKSVRIPRRRFMFWDIPTLRTIASRWSRFLVTGRFS